MLLTQVSCVYIHKKTDRAQQECDEPSLLHFAPLERLIYTITIIFSMYCTPKKMVS